MLFEAHDKHRRSVAAFSILLDGAMLLVFGVLLLPGDWSLGATTTATATHTRPRQSGAFWPPFFIMHGMYRIWVETIYIDINYRSAPNFGSTCFKSYNLIGGKMVQTSLYQLSFSFSRE